MKCDINTVCWNVCFDFFPARLLLYRFRGEVAHETFPAWDIAKPFFRQGFHFVQLHIARYYHDSILRCIVFFKKGLDILHLGLFNMFQFFTNRRPSVRMFLISQRSQSQPYIPIWLIEVALFELFTYHLPLYVKALFTKSQTEHAVAFQP